MFRNQPILPLLFIFFLFSVKVYSQEFTVGYDFKKKMMRDESPDKFLMADNTSAFYMNVTGTLYCYNISNNVNGQYNISSMRYEKQYSQAIEKQDWQDIWVIHNELYLITRVLNKKDAKFIFSIAKINKTDGNLVLPLRVLKELPAKDGKATFDAKLNKVEDNLIEIVFSVKTELFADFEITRYNQAQELISITPIHHSGDPEKLVFDRFYTTDKGDVIVLTKLFQNIQEGKKNTIVVFKEYRMSLYSSEGNLVKDFTVNQDDFLVRDMKISDEPGDGIYLIGLYINPEKSKENWGFFTAKANETDIKITHIQKKPFYKSITGNELADTTKPPPGKFGDRPHLGGYYIKSIFFNKQAGTWFVSAEDSWFSGSYYGSVSMRRPQSTTYYNIYRVYNIMLLSVGMDGSLKWIKCIPKRQNEIQQTISGYSKETFYYFEESAKVVGSDIIGFPYYVSHAGINVNNKYILFFNDHVKNNKIFAYGSDSMAIDRRFAESALWSVIVDLKTGEMVRKMVIKNNNDAILLPKFGFLNGNTVLLPAIKEKMMGKTSLTLCTIQIK